MDSKGEVECYSVTWCVDIISTAVAIAHIHSMLGRRVSDVHNYIQTHTNTRVHKDDSCEQFRQPYAHFCPRPLLLQ